MLKCDKDGVPYIVQHLVFTDAFTVRVVYFDESALIFDEGKLINTPSICNYKQEKYLDAVAAAEKWWHINKEKENEMENY